MPPFAQNSHSARQIQSWLVVEVAEAWRRNFGIDVRPLFGEAETLTLLECPVSGIRYFEPSVTGDDAFYQRLESFDWYYLPDRWEFPRALQTARPGMRLLEVGAGRGAFLAFAQREGMEGVGLELNSAAAAIARTRGLNVETRTVDDLAATSPSTFDRVVAFQVLEHVKDPLGMALAMAACARPGGTLCIAVPNATSFIRHARLNLLDMPPHHVTRWTPDALRWIGSQIGAAETAVEPAPLETIHIDGFLSACMAEKKYRRIFNNRISRPVLRQCLACGGRYFINGQTIYAEYQIP